MRDTNGKVEGVIFDVDGTLVDSNAAHARAWVEAIAEAGREVPLARIRPLIGMGGDKLLPEATGVSAESAEGKAIAERRGEIFRSVYLPRLQPFAGSRDLLVALKARGFRLAVASSAETKDLAPLLRVAQVDDLLDTKTSGDDAETSKPDPDIVVAALARLECAPALAIMVGDTPYDVAAARGAGVRCVGFRCGGWGDEDLAGAIAVYDGPLDLWQRLDSSPLRGSD